MINDIINNILSGLEIWLMVASAELIMFTFLWKKQTKKWWWKKNDDFNIWFNSNGWGIEGTGNPLKIFEKMLDKLIEDENDESKK